MADEDVIPGLPDPLTTAPGQPSIAASEVVAVSANTAHDVASDFEAIVAGAPVVFDDVEPQDLDLAPDDRERVDGYVARASAKATLRAYRSDWDLFVAWCAENRYQPLPASPRTVAAFLTLLADRGFVPRALKLTKPGRERKRPDPRPLSKATIERRLAAIVFAHRAAGVEPPTSQPGSTRRCGGSARARSTSPPPRSARPTAT